MIETVLLTFPVGIGCLTLSLLGLIMFGGGSASMLAHPLALKTKDWPALVLAILVAAGALFAVVAVIALAYLTVVFLRRDGWGLLTIPRKAWMVCLVAAFLCLMGAICLLLRQKLLFGGADTEILSLLTCFVYGTPLLIPLMHLRLELSNARREHAMLGRSD